MSTATLASRWPPGLSEGTEPMPTMLTGKELSDAIQGETFIRGGDPSCAEGVKYDFRLSPHVLKAKFNRPVDASRMSEFDQRDLQVDPGEVVFVLTQEHLALPNDITAQLSPKRKLSHAGILTLGGFCIDPGYAGPLLIGLFNFSSTPFQLIPGKKLIAATFYRLEGGECGTFPTPEPLVGFPDELIQVMQKYQPLAVQAVADTVRVLEGELATLRNEMRSHENWYTRFKDSLEAHNAQIGMLSRDLTNERDVRMAGQDKLSEAVTTIQRTLSKLEGAALFVKWVFGVGVALGLALLGAWLAKTLGWA